MMTKISGWLPVTAWAMVFTGWVFGSACLAQPLVIDNFEEGPFSITDDPSPGSPFDVQDSLSAVNVYSTRRVAGVYVDSGTGNATLALSVDTPNVADDSVALDVDANTKATVSLGYYPLSIDLTAGGRNAFQVVLSQAMASGVLEVFVEDDLDGKAEMQLALAGAGVYNLPFSSFGPNPFFPDSLADFTRIAQIELHLYADTAGVAQSLAVSDFLVVPEPSIGLVFILGLVFGGRGYRVGKGLEGNPPA